MFCTALQWEKMCLSAQKRKRTAARIKAEEKSVKQRKKIATRYCRSSTFDSNTL